MNIESPTRERSTGILRIILLLVIMFGLLLHAGVSASQAVLQLHEDSVNLGRMGINEKKKGAIQITNGGTEDLLIEKIHSTCGCIIIDKQLQRLRPGQEGRMEFQVITDETMHGEVTKALFIKSNDAVMPLKPVPITFYVKPDYALTCIPAKINFGQLGNGASGQKFVTLISPYPSQLDIKGITSSNKAIEARMVGSSNGDSMLRLAVTIDPNPCPVGVIDEQIIIETNIGKKTIPVVGRKIGRLDWQPETLVFGIVTADTGWTHTLTVRNRETRQFRITRVEDQNGAVEIRLNESRNEGNAEHTISVVPKADMPKGVFKGIIEIDTDLDERIRIAYYGIKR
jgi:hypothetical protein